ncbi:MAG: SSS family solute:Na+ symporter, partial [Chitinophagales bacterium]
MEQLDWIIFGVYLIFVFLLGIWASKKASTGIESYFVADRNLPWWWLGISIIATTFAADTPLAVTGITAKNGIVGNWLWWSWAATY